MPDQLALVEALGSLNDVQRTQANGGRFRALLIKEGWGSCGYYSEEVLRRDGPTAWPAGTHGYIDHPTLTEQAELPERSALRWASLITTDPVWDELERGLVAEVEVFPQWRGLLNEDFAGHVGLSIRAYGTAEQGEADGKKGPIVTSITEGISVDWVTSAGAGGRVLELIESARARLSEVSDKPWSDFGQGDYTIEQWRSACLIGPDSPSDNKGDYKLPVKEPGGALNRNAVHAAAGAHGVTAVKGVSADKKKAAAKKLVSLYRNQLHEDPPAGLLRAAGETTSESARKTQLAEARNVCQWLEARVHTAFTGMADDMYGNGRLSRDERIGLSNAISDALEAFAKRVEADHPQLLQRDLWDEPGSADGEMSEAARLLADTQRGVALRAAVREAYSGKGILASVRDQGSDDDGDWVVFSLESAAGDSALYRQAFTVDEASKALTLDGQPTEVTATTTYAPAGQEPETGTNASGGKPATQKEEGSMPELTDEQAREVTEARDKAVSERDAARTDAELARTELARFRAAEAARPLAAAIIAESGLPAAAQTKILGQVVSAETVPLTEQQTLDEAKFKTTVGDAVKAEQTYLASLAEAGGAGQPRGLGDSPGSNGQGQPADPKVTEALAEAYTARGLSKEAARLAAAGRPL